MAKKTYEVLITQKLTLSDEVEAESEEEAMKIAEERYCNDEYSFLENAEIDHEIDMAA